MYIDIYCEHYNSNTKEHLNGGNDGGDNNVQEDDDGADMKMELREINLKISGDIIELVGNKSTELNIVNDDVDS